MIQLGAAAAGIILPTLIDIAFYKYGGKIIKSPVKRYFVKKAVKRAFVYPAISEMKKYFKEPKIKTSKTKAKTSKARAIKLPKTYTSLTSKSLTPAQSLIAPTPAALSMTLPKKVSKLEWTPFTMQSYQEAMEFARRQQEQAVREKAEREYEQYEWQQFAGKIEEFIKTGETEGYPTFHVGPTEVIKTPTGGAAVRPDIGIIPIGGGGRVTITTQVERETETPPPPPPPPPETGEFILTG